MKTAKILTIRKPEHVLMYIELHGIGRWNPGNGYKYVAGIRSGKFARNGNYWSLVRCSKNVNRLEECKRLVRLGYKLERMEPASEK